MKVFVLQSYGTQIDIFSTLESAKNVAQAILAKDGYEDDDYHWHDSERHSTCYSELYIDQPENDVYSIEVKEVQ